jgi:site-specific recombinase XerD
MDRKIYIDGYKLALSVRQLQYNTVQNYMGHLQLFLNFCQANNITPEDGNKMWFLKWINEAQSESTIKQRIGMLQNLYTISFLI